MPVLHQDITWACFLSLARSKLRLCSANHRAGYFSNLACDWLSIVWAYSEQETETGPWTNADFFSCMLRSKPWRNLNQNINVVSQYRSCAENLKRCLCKATKAYNFLNLWWRHQMETFLALLALCAGNLPVTGEIPSQRPVTWNFDVFFDLRLNKCLTKQSRWQWFEMPSHSLWRHCDVPIYLY